MLSKFFSQLCGLIVAGFGVVAIVGWLIGSRTLTGMRAEYIPMAPNTAFSFIVLGTSLCTLITERKGGLLISRIGAIVVFVLSLIRSTEFSVGINLNVDRWIFQVAGEKLGLVPIGQMALPTAFNFLFAGAALFLASLLKKSVFLDALTSILAGLITFIGLAFCLGYIYGAPLLYGGTVIPMALNTAIAFFGLGLGLVINNISHDIAERKRAAEALRNAYNELEMRVSERTAELAKANKALSAEIIERRRAENELRLLQTMTQAVTEAEDFHEALRITLQKVCEATEWVYGEAWIPATDHQVLEHSGVSYSKGEKYQKFTVLSKSFTFARAIGLPGRVWSTKQTEWIPDVSINGKVFLRSEYALEMGYKAAFGVPIVAADEVIAVLVFFMLAPRTGDKRLVEVVSAAAIQLGSVLQRKRAEEEIRNAEMRYRTTLDHMLEGCQIIGFDWRYLYVNDVAAAHGRRTKEELLGRTMMGMYPGIESTPMFAKLRHSMEQRVPQRMENEFTFPDGTKEWFDLSVEPVPEGIFILSADITGRKRAEEALRASEARLNDAQRLAHIGSWELDLVTNTLVWSDEIYRIFEIDPEAFGASYEAFLDTVHPEDRVSVEKAYTDSVKNKTPYEIVHRLLMPDGRIKYVHEQCETFYDQEDKPLRSIGTVQDVTERRRAEQDILKLNAELEQRVIERTAQLEGANKELEAFAYSVSHDLRSPLRGIDGFSQALLEDHAANLDDEGKSYLRRVRAAAQRMAQLIDDMLSLSRVTRSEMHTQPVDLGELATQITEELRKEQPERNVEFVISSRVMAVGDRPLLRIMLENLLGNAWKFTSKHTKVRIEFGVMEHEGKQAYFVRDDGAGFEMAYADKLFGAFQRLHPVSEFPGTGVGLATVQRIIHRHGGRVWAHGDVEKGATFYFTL